MLSLVNAHAILLKNSTTFFDWYLYRPMLDENEFTQTPFEFFQSTTWDADKKIIIGTTSEEGIYFILPELQGPVTRNDFTVRNMIKNLC